MTSLDTLRTKLEGSVWNPTGLNIKSVGNSTDTNIKEDKLFYTVKYGLNSKACTVREEQAEFLLEYPNIFKYHFIGGYKAIWSEELQCVECEISSESLKFAGEKLKFDWDLEGDLTIQYATPEFLVLTQLKKKGEKVDINKIKKILNDEPSDSAPKRSLTIKITGRDVNKDKLGDVIHIFNSACFSLERYNDNIHCVPAIDIILEKPTNVKLQQSDSVTFEPLSSQCEDALAIYGHAHSMNSSKLLLQKFLGFYQVLENLYSIYTDKAAKEAISQAITSNVDRENTATVESIFQNLKKILSKKNDSDMLKEMLQKVFDKTTESSNYASLKRLLCKHKSYYSKIHWDNGDLSPARKVHSQKITVPNSENGERRFISDISTRIYGIRCRIVHATNDSKQENPHVLHARSPEVAHIVPDVALVEFLAKHVLMYYSSSPQE